MPPISKWKWLTRPWPQVTLAQASFSLIGPRHLPVRPSAGTALEMQNKLLPGNADRLEERRQEWGISRGQENKTAPRRWWSVHRFTQDIEHEPDCVLFCSPWSGVVDCYYNFTDTITHWKPPVIHRSNVSHFDLKKQTKSLYYRHYLALVFVIRVVFISFT